MVHVQKKKYTTHTGIHVFEEYSATLTAVLSKSMLFRAQKKDTLRSESFLAYMICYSTACIFLICFYTLSNSDVNRKAKCKKVI